MRDKLLCSIVVVGVAARLIYLRGSLWYDEAFSAGMATLPYDQLLEATLNDVHPPLYYAFLWGINRLAGHSEIVLRLPSLAAGIALIVVVDRLASRIQLSDPARFMAVVITATAPFQLYYSTEARSYAFQMLAVSLAALGLLERRYWLFVLGSLVAVYLQHTSVLFILGLLTAEIARNDDAPDWRRLTFCAGAIGIGYLPGLLFLIQQAQRVGGGYWILPLDHAGRVFDAADSLLWYTPNNPFFLTSLVTGLALVLILADLRLLWEEQRFSLVMVGAPLLLAVVVSLAWQSIMIARILAPATPFLYILIGYVVSRSQRRYVLWGGAAAVFGVAIVGAVVTGRAGRTMDNYYAIPDLRPDDGIYHTNTGSIVLWQYYLPEVEQVIYQQNVDLEQNLTTATKTAMGMRQATFGEIACQKQRWWYVSMHNPTSTAGEIAHAAYILGRYPSREIRVLRNDRLVDSRLYLIEPECGSERVDYFGGWD